MRVAIFCTTLPQIDRKPGGVEVAVHRLANELVDNQNIQVTVMALSEKAPIDAKYDYQQLFPKWPWLRDRRLARLFVLPALLNFVDMKGFDVVHLHGDDWFYFHRQCPTVRTLNGSALREAQSASSWKRRLIQYILYPLEHLSTRLADLPLALGPDTASIYGIDEIIDYGVSINKFTPGQKAKKPRIFFIGTWGGRKRGNFIFNIFINQILPNVPSAELVIACEKELVPHHPQVLAVGFPSDEELAKMYREAWVFAYPSIYEGFGIPYIEAMASGTSIVCSDNTGAEYVLDHGKYGMLVKDHEFGKAILSLLQSEQVRMQFELVGLERAKYFNWNAVAERHIHMYLRSIENWNSNHIEKPKI
jgi:glycosyltransferase involved in cell wall biosynthesis